MICTHSAVHILFVAATSTSVFNSHSNSCPPVEFNGPTVSQMRLTSTHNREATQTRYPLCIHGRSCSHIRLRRLHVVIGIGIETNIVPVNIAHGVVRRPVVKNRTSGHSHPAASPAPVGRALSWPGEPPYPTLSSATFLSLPCHSIKNPTYFGNFDNGNCSVMTLCETRRQAASTSTGRFTALDCCCASHVLENSHFKDCRSKSEAFAGLPLKRTHSS